MEALVKCVVVMVSIALAYRSLDRSQPLASYSALPRGYGFGASGVSTTRR